MKLKLSKFVLFCRGGQVPADEYLWEDEVGNLYWFAVNPSSDLSGFVLLEDRVAQNRERELLCLYPKGHATVKTVRVDMYWED